MLFVIAASVLLVPLCGALERSSDAQCKTPDGGFGTCVNTTTQPCYAGLVYDSGCEAGLSCCATSWGPCKDSNGTGTCMLIRACPGINMRGDCTGPDSVQCCTNAAPPPPPPSGWTREDCFKVAAAWTVGQVLYNWSPAAKQFVTYGQGPYRSDCSGFVSAAWDIGPPGATTAIMLPNYAYRIDASELTMCDALLDPQDHVALFMGWNKTMVPIVTEECGHSPDCCGSQATCPGACGTADDCNEYCPGCPVQTDAWTDGLRGFIPIRRLGW